MEHTGHTGRARPRVAKVMVRIRHNDNKRREACPPREARSLRARPYETRESKRLTGHPPPYSVRSVGRYIQQRAHTVGRLARLITCLTFRLHHTQPSIYLSRPSSFPPSPPSLPPSYRQYCERVIKSVAKVPTPCGYPPPVPPLYLVRGLASSEPGLRPSWALRALSRSCSTSRAQLTAVLGSKGRRGLRRVATAIGSTVTRPRSHI